MGQSWTKEKVRDKILGLHKKVGKINSNFVQKEHRALYCAAVYHFGDWKKAVQFAGFRYADVKIKKRPVYWTKERIIAQITEIHQKEGEINSNFIQVHYSPLYGAATRLFGSWQKAVEAAGFDYGTIRVKKPFRKWSKKAIVTELKRRQKRGLALNAKGVCKDDYGLYLAAKRYFGKGGWNKALRRIGLNSNAVFAGRIWTKQKVIGAIQTLYKAGSPLYAYYLQKNGYSNLVAGAVKVFGSWKKAIESAGYKYEDVKAVRTGHWTKTTIIKVIKRLEKMGVRLSSKATQMNMGDLFSSARLLFGSWGQAVESAGINYHEHSLTWSTKAWLRKLSKSDVQRIVKKSETFIKKRRSG